MKFITQIFSVLIVVLCSIFSNSINAQNPIIQTCYTADPAPMVGSDGKLYLYTGHDEDASTWFTMLNWQVFATTDMVNWTAHKSPLSFADFSWSKNDAWAGQTIERNGKYYWYVPTIDGSVNTHGIGVAVSNKPTSGFADALAKPLIPGVPGYIDPTVFINDDGQAYLYWGNNGLWYAKLKENMIELDGGIVKVEVSLKNDNPAIAVQTPAAIAAFGPDFEEAPWVYKRNGKYYMLYAAEGVPEKISYSMSDSPTGPWMYKGVIMDVIPTGGAFTNHAGIVDYKGHSYFFYHNGALPGGGGFTRSVCVEEFSYNADGTIPKITSTKTGITTALENLNPYLTTQGETMAWEEGIEIGSDANNVFVTDVDKGDCIKVRSVDFGTIGAAVFTANVSSTSNGGTIELRLDSKSGSLIGTLPVCNTAGAWQNESTAISGATGVHDLYLVFNSVYSGKILNINNWQFTEKKNSNELVAINATSETYRIDIQSGSNTTNYKINAIYADGTAEDVTTLTQLSFSKAEVVTAANGTIAGVNYGAANVVARYLGKVDTMAILVKSIASELTLKQLTTSSGNIAMLTGDSKSIVVNAEYLDGHTTDITLNATIQNFHPEIVEFENGTLKSNSEGIDTIRFSYKGELGATQYLDLVVKVQTFPLTQSLFNPSIWTDGTFNETTLELKTGQYGFGGWHYANGIDLSGYKYLVVDLAKTNTCGASLRLFDEDNYWGTPASYDFGAQKRVIVPLATMKKGATTAICNASHLYIIGFWTFGNAALSLKDIYLTNSDTYEKPSAVDNVYLDDPNKLVDVYTLMGVKIKSQVKQKDAILTLNSGLYIIDKQKIFINKR